MARAVRHRGPDGFGLALRRGAGLVSTRLAIFDIPPGWQPMQAPTAARSWSTTARSSTTPSCAAELEARGGIYLDDPSDTEVVLRLLERDGLAALDKLNGQFAFALVGAGPRAR